MAHASRPSCTLYSSGLLKSKTFLTISQLLFVDLLSKKNFLYEPYSLNIAGALKNCASLPDSKG